MISDRLRKIVMNALSRCKTIEDVFTLYISIKEVETIIWNELKRRLLLERQKRLNTRFEKR